MRPKSRDMRGGVHPRERGMLENRMDSRQEKKKKPKNRSCHPGDAYHKIQRALIICFVPQCVANTPANQWANHLPAVSLLGTQKLRVKSTESTSDLSGQHPSNLKADSDFFFLGIYNAFSLPFFLSFLYMLLEGFRVQ